MIRAMRSRSMSLNKLDAVYTTYARLSVTNPELVRWSEAKSLSQSPMTNHALTTAPR